MKNRFSVRLIAKLLTLLFVLTISDMGLAQAKKEKLRLSVKYFKTSDQDASLNILARFKGENGFENVPGIPVEIFQVVEEDSLIRLGTGETDGNGVSKFVIKNYRQHISDTTSTLSYLVTFEENDAFKGTDQDVSVEDISLKAEVKMIDSLNYVVARLSNPNDDSAIVEGELKVRLKRLFKPLTIGDDTYFTDENGEISVELPNDLPGENGNLTFEVVLDDSDTYGTVIASIESPIGVPIVDQSTYDERTLWSPRNKTPLFLWIFPNLIIFGIWTVIILSILNLIKIYKSNS
jgi:hypothetical protein